MKKIFPIAFLILSSFSYSQTYETLSKVWIPNNAVIIKKVKVKNCKTKVDAGFIVKTEFTKKHKGKTYTFTKLDTLKDKTSFFIEKEVEIKLKNFSGYANLSIDEKDKTKLLVNYWLNDNNTIKKGKKIKIKTKTLNCPKDKKPVESDYSIKEEEKTLTEDTTFLLWKVTDPNKTKWYEKMDWYIHSDKVIEVYNDIDEVEYYLVNKYDRNATYEMKLKNREFISYAKKSFEFGPLTIPFKYRFGYTNNNIDVKQQFEADLNIGVFGGYRLGKYRVRYEGSSFKQLASLSFTVGGFLSLSSVSLDKSNTTAGENPFMDDEKSSIGTISPGIGIMLDVYNVNLGVFLGLDVGFGSDAKNWNHNNRPWIGLGIGYNLNGFWKK